MIYSVFVLVIVCLCVLGLVILIVIMVGMGVGVWNGILIKGGEVLEVVVYLDSIVLDKIGMIIEGKFKVIDLVGFKEVLFIFYILE